MGIRNHTNCVATIAGVSSGLMTMLRSDFDSVNNHPLTIDFDVNLLAMNKCRSCDSAKACADRVIAIMKALSLCGCVCAPIADPEHRHHTKRDTIHRRKDKLFHHFDSMLARYELVQIENRINDANM